ncbi:MAG: T9SS type A sorting domain-containing protein, partial [Saprospiraceae bacterium]|nr:T9SS type A sorting domain-containing protein [Saprospiraceae bacterium]
LWTQPNALAGWMYKFDNNLDSIWSREDTVFYNLQIYTEHWLNGAVQLPSGSVIAAGQINVYYPAPGKSWGWLIKVNRDGCIDTLACSVSAIIDQKNSREVVINVYPNPTNGLLFFDETEVRWDKIEIIDSQGRVMKVFNSFSKHELDLKEMPVGIYTIRFVRQGESVVRRILKM